MEMKRRRRRALAVILVLAMMVSSLSTTRVSATAKGITKLSVSKPAAGSLALLKGESYQLKYQVKPARLKKKIVFTSSKRSVVSVTTKGKLLAKAVGAATITVKSRTKPAKTVKVKVTVKKKLLKVSKITLQNKKYTMTTGEQKKLMVTYIPKKATIQKSVFQSSKSSVAVVDSKGIVTAKKAGSTKIRVYAKDGRGASAVCSITVCNPDSPSAQPSDATSSVTPSAQPSTQPSTRPSTQPDVIASAEPSIAPSMQPSTMPSTSPEIPVAGIVQDEEDAFILTKGNQATTVYVDEQSADYDGLRLVADSFAEDLQLVADETVSATVLRKSASIRESVLVVGSIGNNDLIDAWIEQGKIAVDDIQGKNEVYKTLILDQPTDTINRALVVIGSDKRGAIYGLYHISEQMGVSPWTYWADVIPQSSEETVLTKEVLTTVSKEPSVTYRGIFLNDEAPSLTGWVKDKFGNYNEEFYEKVYELILRLKGNYLWPAMWSNTFSEDGEATPIANAKLADQYGIVMGTSHHEPLCRAGVEWQAKYRQYGSSNAWDFTTNKTAITNFWKDGLVRNKNFENVYTLGMRGESDSSLEGTLEENVNLLKDVITTQKQLLADNNLSNSPQVLTVYKEVEDYWHGNDTVDGLKNWNVLDDVTIMLCDDNFGNMRTLPEKSQKNRAGGWGMYYHFDYHGGPTSYEWVNTVELNKVWEQMTMAYDYGIDDIWIVNVGDLKPMEMNISYFLDMAYDYDTWGTNGCDKAEEYQKQWISQQLGDETSDVVKNNSQKLIEEYTWLNGSCKPETLSAATYSAVNYEEAKTILNRVEAMIDLAETTKSQVSQDQQAAFYELVYFPAVASANVAKIQIYAGLNQYCYQNNLACTNLYAILLEKAIAKDKALEQEYNNNMPGVGNKWKNMMSSPHVGFVTWNSDGWKYPEPCWYNTDSQSMMALLVSGDDEVYTDGEVKLPSFSNQSKQAVTLELTNTGGDAYNYTATSHNDWIQLSESSGLVTMYRAISVTIDWSKVTESQSGTITLEGNGQTMELQVDANVIDTQGLSEGTYLYENGYASMSAAGYTTKQNGSNGESYQTIHNYGKMGDSVKAFPSDASFDGNESEAPFVEYHVMVPESGNYKLTTYSAPSNPIAKGSTSIRYGVSVNGSEVTTVNSIASNYVSGAYSGSWSNDVKANGRKSETTIALTEGENVIRYSLVDPCFVLQKAVVSKDSVKTSHLGPQESHAVGQDCVQKEAVTVLENSTSYALPGVIEKIPGKMEYSVVISEEEEYQFKIKGSSADQAVVKLLWNQEEIGETTLKSQENVYTISKTKKLPVGEGKLTLQVVNGTANIETIKAKTVKHTPVNSVFINASSNQSGYIPELVMDDEVETVWKPEVSDISPWIELDWNDTYQFDRFAISQIGNNIDSVQVAAIVGDDAETIYSSTNVENGRYVFLQGKKEIKAQKIRFTFTGENIEITELKVTPYINWAAEDANIVWSGEKNGGVPFDITANVADGDRIAKGLVYSAGGNSDTTRHQVTMQFSQPRMIDTVRLFTLQEAENSSAGSGVIPTPEMTSSSAQYSYNFYYKSGNAWYPIGGTTKPASGNPKVMCEFALKQAVEAEAVKVEIYTSNWIRINEFEAVESQRILANPATATQTYTQDAEQYEVALDQKTTIGAIKCKMVTPANLAYEYWDEVTQSYVELASTDIDWVTTASGMQAVLAKGIETSKIRISAEETVGISEIAVYPMIQTTASSQELKAPVITNISNVVIPYGKASKSMILKSEAVSTHAVSYRYKIVKDDSNIASLIGSKLRFTGEGNVIIQVTALANGVKRYTTKEFTVTKATEPSPTYKDYADTINGGSITRFPGVVEVAFDGCKDIDYLSVHSTSGVVEDMKLYYLQDGKWILFSNGTVTGNTEETFTLSLDEGVSTPAVRLQLTNGAENESTQAITFAAKGDVVVGTGCICQLGKPTFANAAQVEINPTTGTADLQLLASVVYYARGCGETNHSTSIPNYSYSLEANPGNIASINGATLHFTDMGTVEVKVTAKLNELTTSNTMSITSQKAGYVNYALSSMGSQASGSEISESLDPSNVIDGDTTFANAKRWRTTSFPSYMEVDFGQNRTIDLISLFSQQESGNVTPTATMTSKYAPAKFTISYWDETTQNWVVFDGGNVTGNNKVWHKLSLATPVTTKKIRYDCATAVCDNWWRIVEIQAWGYE